MKQAERTPRNESKSVDGTPKWSLTSNKNNSCVDSPTNRAVVSSRLNSIEAQPNLELSAPGDKYERETDRVAKRVMNMPDTASPEGTEPVQNTLDAAVIQRMCSRCHKRNKEGKPLNCSECEQELQRKESPDGNRNSPINKDQKKHISSLKGSGISLPSSARSFFEPRFGRDFSNVRLHTGVKADRAARSVNAKAFTMGDHVVFRSGMFKPGSQKGKQLLAHELTHFLQQGVSNRTLQRQEDEPEDNNQSGETSNTDNCTIYLTFDDGPGLGTDDVFEVLQDLNLNATFFFVGEALDTGFNWEWKGQENWSGEEIMELFEREGHLIASHSVSHANIDDEPGGEYRQWYNQTGRVVKEFREMRERLDEELGEDYPGSDIVRLPGRNTWRISEREQTDPVHGEDSGEAADRLSQNQFSVFGWDVEYSKGHHDNQAPVLGSVRDECESSGSVVILFHDRHFRESRGNKQYLRTFLIELKNKGYRFDTMNHYS